MKKFLFQYEKDLNDLYNFKKCPNDFSLKYFLLLTIPEIVISSLFLYLIILLKVVFLCYIFY